MLSQRVRSIPVILVLAGATALLAACSPTTAAGPGDSGGTGGDTSGDSGGSGGAALVTLPGTGSYAIGSEAPFGGYQLTGEPAEQPDGCTWSIVDADGAVTFENQGSYAFLTDVEEAVTFVTSGCPDWEQFE